MKNNVTREEVFTALVGLTAEITWGAPGFQRSFINNVDNLPLRRRVKLFSDANMQPAIYQAEHDEEVAQTSNLAYKRAWKASWIIYQQTGKDQSVAPAIENNLILDAIDRVIAPKPSDPGFQGRRNTLGGLVYHCYLDGEIFKDPGDIDDQGMMVVPITMLIP